MEKETAPRRALPPPSVLAATHAGSWADHAARVTTTAGVSLPIFFTGLLLVYVFYYLLGWAPAPLGFRPVKASPTSPPAPLPRWQI